MSTPPLHVRPFAAGDEAAVARLWERCGLTRPWNDPLRDIERKLAVDAALFLVGVVADDAGGRLVASAMGGYDGHRGWVNYLAVDPDCRRSGYGRVIMATLERKLLARGCPKLNLQVRADNLEALAFYAALGYQVDAVTSLGKRLIADGPAQHG